MFRRHLILHTAGGCGIGRVGIRIARIRSGAGHAGLLRGGDKLRHDHVCDLLQFLVGRKALQNRHRTAADQREQRRRALNLERLCDGGIGCDVDAGQLDLAVELVHRVTQCACHGEQTVVGRHPQEQQNRERGGGLHHGLERVLRGVDDISASRRSAARLPRLGLHLMLERFQINGSRQ